MDWKNRPIILLLLIMIPALAEAQVNRYIVYLVDKTEDEYSLANPEEYLSDRALERRNSQGLSIDLTDIPVSSAHLQALRESGFNIFYPSKWLNAVLVQTDASRIPELEALPFVTTVELASADIRLPNGRRSSKFNETTRAALTNEEQLRWHGIDRMHKNNNLGEDRMIAVLDGGFVGVNTIPGFEHIYNESRLVMAENIVEASDDVYKWSSHGSKVLSVIGASNDQYLGVSPQSSFMLFVTEDVYSESRIEEYNWTIAAEKSDSAGVDVINTSLGYSTFDDPSMDYSYEDMDGRTTIISRMAEMAASKGIVVVASAGNAGNSSWKYITAPADANNILSVGAVSLDSIKASFSSFGPSADGRVKPDIASVGVATVLLDVNGEVSSSSGTSFSAPMISGYVALLWNEFPELSSTELIDMIKQAGHLAASPGEGLGFGIPDIQVVLSTDFEIVEELFVYPNPVRDILNIQVPGNLSEAEYSVIDLNGRTLRNGFFNQREVINVGDLPNGLYILEIRQNDLAERKRFIKQ